MTEGGFYFDLENHRPPGWDGWWTSFETLQKLMKRAGLPSGQFQFILGIKYPSYISQLKLGTVEGNVNQHSGTARKLIEGLRQTEEEIAGKLDCSTAILNAWRNNTTERHALASTLDQMLDDEAARINSADRARIQEGLGSAPSSAGPFPAIAVSSRGSTASVRTDYRPSELPLPAQRSLLEHEGRTTGTHFASAPELMDAGAEWQETNLAPGERQKLLLRLSFEETSMREEGEVLRVRLDTIDCYVDLDGGAASERESWTERSELGPERLRIDVLGFWNDEKPSFLIRNEASGELLKGRFAYFPLLEVDGEVGRRARVALLARLNGIEVTIPEKLLERLRSSATIETPNEKLAKQWLRLNAVPEAELVGGRWIMAEILLNKDNRSDESE